MSQKRDISWPDALIRLRTWKRCCRRLPLFTRTCPRRDCGFRLVPKGRESYLERCKELVAELGIGAAVTFEGHIDIVREAYSAGSIVALSSVSEGFPYS